MCKNEDLLFFIWIFLLVSTIFLVRFSPITKEGFNLNYEIINNHMINVKNYVNNLEYGINSTKEPNSIGGMILFYPSSIYPYPFDFFYYSIITIFLTTTTIYFLYIYLNRSKIIYLIFLYYPINSILFQSAYATFIPVLLLILNIIFYLKKKYILSYIILTLSSIFRPELIIVLFVEILLELKNYRKINYNIFFIILYIFIFCTSMYLVYNDPLAQYTYNSSAKINAINIYSLVKTLIAIFILFLIIKYNDEKLVLYSCILYIIFFIILLFSRSMSLQALPRIIIPIFLVFGFKTINKKLILKNEPNTRNFKRMN